MRAINVKNLITATGLGLAMISGTAMLANGQNRDRQDNGRQDNKRQEQVDKLQQKRTNDLAKAEQQRVRAEQERAKAEAERLRLEQIRQTDRNRNHGGLWPVGSGQGDRNGSGNWNSNNNGNWNNNDSNRFRIYRNGSYYNTDQRGADLLRQAVNAGYQQGFQAGRNDRNSRRNLNWSGSSVYRSGTFGYQTYVDRGQYQYYFQQGFQRGYQDGYNSRYQYGVSNGGTLQVIGSILDSILDVRRY